MSKFDLKTKIIFIMGLLLIIGFIFTQRGSKNDSESVIKDLHEKAISLEKENEDLKKANIKLDSSIAVIKTELAINKANLEKTQLKLQELNKKRDEISSNVNRLSANGVANALSDYLDKRTKSTNNR